MAKTTTRKKAGATKRGTAKRGSQKRERIDTGADVRYVKRTKEGRFKESDDVGRSQRTDRAKTARKTVKSGYGDQGDRKARTPKG